MDVRRRSLTPQPTAQVPTTYPLPQPQYPQKSTGPVRAVRPFHYCYSTRKILNYLFWGERRGRIAIGNTPDRSDRPDRGLGKVDLLGVVAGILSVVELKCASGSDTPLRALVEGLAYLRRHRGQPEALRAEYAPDAELDTTPP
jgi:hypothetical protein